MDMNVQRLKTEWKYGTLAFDAGDLVFREGDLGAEAYLVESGTVEIRKTVAGDPDGLTLGALGRGEIFGGMALVDDCPRMANAICTAPTILRVVPADVFEAKLQDADPFIRAVVRVLVRNVRANACAKASE